MIRCNPKRDADRFPDWLAVSLYGVRDRGVDVVSPDSITEHHMRVMMNTLVFPGTFLQSSWDGHWFGQIAFRLDHPELESFLVSSGVSPERVRFPLVSFFRHHHLVDDDDLDHAFASAGERYHPERGEQFSGPNWWPLVLERAMSISPTLSPESEEFSVIIFNVGPHLGFRELGPHLLLQDLQDAYLKIVCNHSFASSSGA